MNPVIILPSKTSAVTVKRLEKAGYVPILSDDPDKVVIVTASQRITGDDMLMSAMAALTQNHGSYGNEYRSAFVKELWAKMLKKEPTTQPRPE
jgi:hypothetical protein